MYALNITGKQALTNEYARIYRRKFVNPKEMEGVFLSAEYTFNRQIHEDIFIGQQRVFIKTEWMTRK